MKFEIYASLTIGFILAAIGGCGPSNAAPPATGVNPPPADQPVGPLYVPSTQAAPQQTTITAGDTILPVPTAPQLAWEDAELGMFIHFDIEVFDKDYQITRDRGAGPSTRPRRTAMGMIDPAEFNPTKLDTDQWMKVAQSLGAKYTVFTAKHSSGFLMWQSDLYPFGVKQSPWRDGKGDVVLDYLASAKKFGMLPGLYCSAEGHSWWLTHHPGATYRRGVMHGSPEDVRAFLDMDLHMYRDLWQHAGPIGYMWFDGGVNPFGNELSPLIDQLEPQMVCFNGPQGGAPGGLARWSGNEKGYSNYPTWNTTDISNDQKDRGPGSPEGKYWIPVEANVPLRYHVWMWQSDTENKILSLNALATDYFDSVGRGTNFIVNANIDPDGLVPDADAKRFAEFGDLLRKWFGHSLAETSGQGDTVQVTIDAPQPVDCVSVMEDITQGQRVKNYVVEAMIDGQWKQVCQGESIGHKRIQLFDRVTASAVRIRATGEMAPPIWRKLAVYNIDPLPPDPTNPATTAQSP